MIIQFSLVCSNTEGKDTEGRDTDMSDATDDDQDLAHGKSLHFIKFCKKGFNKPYVLVVVGKEAHVVTPLTDFVCRKRAAKSGPRVRISTFENVYKDFYFIKL